MLQFHFTPELLGGKKDKKNTYDWICWMIYIEEASTDVFGYDMIQCPLTLGSDPSQSKEHSQW